MSAADFADQLTANIIDYGDYDDLDSNPATLETVVTQVGNRFGFEYLPFVTEVYVQARYNATATSLDSWATATVTWSQTGDVVTLLKSAIPSTSRWILQMSSCGSTVYPWARSDHSTQPQAPPGNSNPMRYWFSIATPTAMRPPTTRSIRRQPH